MPFRTICARKNLELAWRRITTARNYPYKKIYREIFHLYEISLNENLDQLTERLAGGSYVPKKCRKVFTPKPSGLQRAISFLDVEDQIVYQAFANVFSNRIRSRRKYLELKTVYSNILNTQSDNIFFFKDWHITYKAFNSKIAKLFNDGYKWIAHFDLAAYYDTISHNLLFRTVFPRIQNDDFETKVLLYFNQWSSENLKIGPGHGIPHPLYRHYYYHGDYVAL